MDGASRNVKALAWTQYDDRRPLLDLDFQLYEAGDDTHRFVLMLVHLKRKRMVLVHMQELCCVLVGVRPKQLVAPGLLGALYVDSSGFFGAIHPAKDVAFALRVS